MAFLPFQPLGLGEHEILGLLLGQCVAVAQGAGLVSGIFTRKRVVVRPVQGAVVIGVAERPPRRVCEGQDITCRTDVITMRLLAEGQGVVRQRQYAVGLVGHQVGPSQDQFDGRQSVAVVVGAHQSPGS